MHRREQDDKRRRDGRKQLQSAQSTLQQRGLDVLPPCQRKDRYADQQQRDEQIKHGA